jgi:sugar phosphate isomerase/epimerase
MRIGIFAKTFPGSDAAAVLGAAAAAGYDAVQFNLACLGLPSMPDATPDGAAEGVAREAARLGLAIAALSGTFNMIHPDHAQREAGLRRLDVVCAAARAMGAPLVTLCTGTRDPGDMWRRHPGNADPEAWRELLQSMERAIAIAERRGVLLGVEPEPANVVEDATAARRLLAEMRSDRLRIVIDPANLIETAPPDRREAVLAEAIATLGLAIALAHAKDRDAQGRVVPAGSGVVDLDRFVALLLAARYEGPIVTHGLEPADAPAVARRLREAIGAARRNR